MPKKKYDQTSDYTFDSALKTIQNTNRHSSKGDKMLDKNGGGKGKILNGGYQSAHYIHPVLFKACVHYFLSNLYFSLNDSPSKTMKIFFISSKKLFSFSRYSNFCISVFPFFSPCQPLL